MSAASHLVAGDGLDPGADRLAVEGPDVEGEGHHDRGEAGQLEPEHDGQAVVHPDELDQRRRAPEELDVDGHRLVDQRAPGEPAGGDENAQQEPEHDDHQRDR